MEEFVETGRRKTSVASVRVRPFGTGKIDINGKSFDEYFPLAIQRKAALLPLAKIEGVGKYDLIIRVKGGGIEGQAAAIRHGIARALVQESEDRRSEFKGDGFLTRDSRMKERKKYGLRGARKKGQFSKR